MNDLEAIDQRKSRRSYLRTPIDLDKLSILNNLIDKCNQEANLSIKLVEDGSEAFNGLTKSYGFFKGVRTLILLKGKKEDALLKEKLGYYGERIILEATKMGLGTCWVGGTFSRSILSDHVGKDEEFLCVITVGNITEEKSLRERVVYRLTHRHSKTIEELYHSDVIPPQWFIDGIRAVQKAPSAVNRQPVKFEYKDGQVTAYVGDSYPSNLIDLGIAKLHFSIAAGGSFELGNHGKYTRE